MTATLQFNLELTCDQNLTNQDKTMYTLEGLVKNSNNTQAEINGKWVPARPIRLFCIWHDFRDAWEVFRRRADAFTWPEGQ